MSDKQREKHLADYWGGYLTRTEAQKVFDETARVIQSQQQTLMNMDAVIGFFAEKLEVKVEDIQAWIKARVEIAEQAAKAAKALELENPGMKTGAAQFGGVEESKLVAA